MINFVKCSFYVGTSVGAVVLCPLPDGIHALVLSDELNELLDPQTELKTTLQITKTQDAKRFKPKKHEQNI